MEKQLHIVSFDVPYPPNYGGIIDVFYKIKELHQLGVKIYLHCFLFDTKKDDIELKKYCEKIYYYKRKSRLLDFFSINPYRVQRRISKELNQNLQKKNFPILFEGLHSTHAMTKIQNEKMFVRVHNIEHVYFYGLAKSELNFFKKLFYYIDGYKIKFFEKNLKNATGIFTISPYDQLHFNSLYGENTHYIPAFHEARNVENQKPKGDYILYHGDLRISDNIKAALFLIDVYKTSDYKFVIASSYREKTILRKVKKYRNIGFKMINKQDDLLELFNKAHVNTLITFQKTGIKLKLLNSLYQGKFIIANSKMIEDTELESLCELANNKKEILQKTKLLFDKEFLNSDTDLRKEKMMDFNPTSSAKKMVDIIFK